MPTKLQVKRPGKSRTSPEKSRRANGIRAKEGKPPHPKRTSPAKTEEIIEFLGLGQSLTKQQGKRPRKTQDSPTTSRQVMSVLELRRSLGLPRRTFARLAGFSERAVADWESGKQLSPAARQRLSEMQRLQEGLATIMQPDFIGTWLQNPNDAFGGLKPLEVIERGEVDRIWRMILVIAIGLPG